MRAFRFRTLLLGIVVVAAACGSSKSSSSDNSSKSSPSTTGQAASSLYSASKPLKVAFIMNGPVTDQGFNTAVYKGIKAVQEKYGSTVAVTYKESVPESPQSSQVIDSLVQDGMEAIFANSFGYHTYMAAAAAKYPNVKFLQWQSSEVGPNLSEFYFTVDESWYLAGMAGGAASKSGKIGMVASFPISSLLAQVNSFQLGAQAVNPGATTRVVWLNSWYDPGKATQAAQSLVSSGVDTLVNALNESSVVQVAASHDLPVVGQAVNQQTFGPNSWLTGAEFIFGPYFIKQIGDMLAGKWQGNQNYIGGTSDGVTAISAFGPRYDKAVPADIQQKIKDRQTQMKSGSFNPWQGPIADQSGTVQVPAGKDLSAADRRSIKYLVKGVLGTAGS